MRINNKKGFTIIEVVLSFTFAIIILASMFAIVINYQNRTEKEKIVSNLLTYKNGILEIVYQDVIGSNIESMESCGSKCIEINITGNPNELEDKVTYKLEGKVDADGNNYIEYRNNNYVLPDSKNNLSKIEDFGYQIDDDNKIFKIEIPITHAELDDEENEENTIEIVVSGKEFEKPVNKLDNPTKVVAVENIIYDDIEHELVEITKLKGVFYYSYDTVLDNGNYTTSGTPAIPTKKEAGTYTIYYYIEGTDDYLAKSGIITVVISQRAVTFKADDASKGYDGTVLEKKTASLISGSLVEGHTATFDIEGSIIEDGMVENVLNDVLIRDAKGNDVTKNYNITKVNGTLKITLVCEWIQKSSSTPTSCTATEKNSNPSNGDTYTYCSSKKYGDWQYRMVVNCNNGSSSTITSKYNFTSQSNASQACNSIPSNDSFCPGSAVNGRSCGTSQLVYYQKIVYEYQCSTKSDTVTLSNQEFSYTGSPVEVKGATSLSGTPITYEYYSSNDCSGEVMGEAPINVGTYSVKAISAGNANSTNQSGNLVYTGSSTCATVRINKGTPIVNLNASTQEYTGNPLGTTASSTKPNGEHVELEYTYKYFTGNSCSGTVLNGSPIDAGTYSVIATSKENNNLVSASSKCASFVVEPKTITYTASASDKIYDGNTNATCAITLQGIASRDNVSATSTGTFDNKNAGQGKTVTCSNVTLTGTGVNNYKITSTSTTTKANITQKTLTVSGFTYSPLTKVYDGKTTAPSGFSVTATAGSGLVSGDSVTIGYTSAAYNDANVANANSITVSGLSISGTSANNYKLSATTYTKTGATITKAQGTISISAKTETYNGSAISIGTASTNSGGAVTYTYYSGESCGGTALSGAPTNAGTYSVKATVAATGNYTSATSSCVKLTINRISVTYKADDATKVYDGTPLTKKTVTLKSGNLVSGHTASFTIEGSITNVGTVTNVLKAVTIKNASGTDVTANYNITMQNGTLTVTIAQGTISLNAKTETYNGSAISIGTASTNSSGTVTYTYYSGESCSGTALSGAPKNAGTYSVKATVSATGNYTTATSNCAKLTINAKTLTYTASASNKTYDGNANATCSITLTGVVSGDTVSATSTGTFSNKNVGNGKTVTCSNVALTGTSSGNYKLSSTSTTTTANITAKILTPLVSANSKIYDGGTGTSCFISFLDVVSGDSVSASAGSATFSDKNVGTSKTVTCSGITLSGTSSSNYKLSSTSATTTASIMQKTLTVADFTYSPLTKVYDGNTSAPSGFKITASGVVSGDNVSVSYTSAAYNNANVANANSIAVSGMSISGTSASNYKLSATTYTKTGATITKATGTVSISAKTETYNGSTISIGTASTNSGGTVTYAYYSGDSCGGTALSGAPTNAGTYSVKATVAATGNYTNATSNCVKLTINRISVTYKSDSASKIYDGTPLTKKTATLISGSLVSGHTATFNITGTITNVGSTDNTLSGVTIKNASGTDVSANYNITKQNGTLTITNPAVNISLSPKTETYNGSAIAANTATTNSDGTITYTYYNGESCSGTALSGAPTNAGTYSVKATTSRTSNFPSATSSCVKHTINQRAVTYKSDSASKAYDGTALTKKTASLISGSLVSGHTATFNITGTITNVGSTANTLSDVTIKNASGTDVSANYNITKQNGTLTITSVSATIPTNSLCVSRTYNGSAQQLTSVTEGTGYTLSGYSKTDAGTHTITATLKTGYTWSNNTTGTQTFTCSIAQKEVTYTANSATKQYDGAALTAQSATLTSGSLVSGHTATFSITGSQTSPGTSTNTLNSVTIKSGSTDVTGNYKITKVNGTLTVVDGTPPTVTFSPNGNSKAAKSQSTKVTVTDNSSTISERRYLWSQSNNASAENGTSFTSGQTITKSDGNGSWYLCIYTKDSAGNATNVCSNYFELDNTPPIITAGNFCTALGTSSDLSKNAVVSDDSQVTVTSSPSTLSTTSIGQTNVTYTATDEAGNTATKTVVASVFTKLYDSKVVTSGAGLYKDPLDDARYIYKGSDAKNYVRFNGSDNWRIMSIEQDGTYKLIYMGTNYASAYNTNSGATAITFTGTTMDTLLNTNFYNSLSADARGMVVSHEFNYGTGNINRTTTTKLSVLYENERKTKINSKVGLMTLTDFFRASNSANCTDSQSLNYISGASNVYCNVDNWLYTNGYEFWTFTPYNDDRMYHLTTTGGYTWDSLGYSHPYRPVVHITEEAVFVAGDGSSGNPYIIDTNCAGTVVVPELKSCSITGNTADNIFEVSVVGGSGSFQYSWNGGAYQTSKKLSFSSVASGNPISASVIVQDKKTSNTVSCSTTCKFTGWTSNGLSYFNYNAAYGKGEAEAANNSWYRTCNSGVLPTVCIQNGVNSGCYACTTYGRSISCS